MVKKLLIVTQKVDKNDPVLGFFHTWLLEFGKKVPQVTVIALSVGAHDLPKNVRVISLGKENGQSRAARTVTFLQQIVALEKEYDSVFVHMNPEYVALAGLIWRGMGKKVALWYTHRNVDLKLRLAVMFSDVVFTASPEGCRVKSKKVKVVGHGIDVDLFGRAIREKLVGMNKTIHLAHFGRLTPIKNCDTIIESFALLKQKVEDDVVLSFVGGPATDGDKAYEAMLISLVKERRLTDQVTFVGNVSHDKLPAFLSTVDVTINATPTGGLDKVVLESMAAGVPVITSNTSFSPILKELASQLIFKERDPKDLASKVNALLLNSDLSLLGDRLKNIASGFDIPGLIERVLGELTVK